MFEYLRYKLTGEVPHYLALFRIAEKYRWLEPEIQPAAVYIVALGYKGTELRAFWSYKERDWAVRMGESEVDRGTGFNTFIRALKTGRTRRSPSS